MAQPFDIAGYTYRADHWCGDCLLAELTPNGLNTVSELSAERCLDLLAEAYGLDREDEWRFDSMVFPKVLLRDQVRFDANARCSNCGMRLA